MESAHNTRTRERLSEGTESKEFGISETLYKGTESRLLILIINSKLMARPHPEVPQTEDHRHYSNLGGRKRTNLFVHSFLNCPGSWIQSCNPGPLG